MMPRSRPDPTPRAGARVPSPRLAAVALVLCGALAGCSILGSGGDRGGRSTIFAPDPRATVAASAPSVDWQLAVSQPTGARAIDSYRIAVRPTRGELQVYRGASWARTPGDMLQDALLRALEDSGKIDAIARQGSGLAADYRLVIDLRRFEAEYAGDVATPSVVIEFNAKLLHPVDQGIVASRTFLRTEPAAGVEVPVVVEAFSRGLETVTGELAEWILVSGDAHQRRVHHDAR